MNMIDINDSSQPMVFMPAINTSILTELKYVNQVTNYSSQFFWPKRLILISITLNKAKKRQYKNCRF